MAFYIQYDETGRIMATVNSSVEAPACSNQLRFEEYVDTSGKKINLDTLSLEDAPIIKKDE